MRRIDFTNGLGLFFSLYILMPVPAHAYFDLSTGNYIIQLLVAFGAAFWFSVRGAWKNFSFKKGAAPSGVTSVTEPSKPEATDDA